MASKLERSLKQVRDRLIDKVLMERSAFIKAARRMRQKENTFAYVAKDRNGLKFLYAPTDFTIGAALNVRGSWQYEELNHYLEFLAACAQDKTTFFFDIGANIGTQTVYASRSGLFSRVFAIEAMPSTFELLSSNVVLNGYAENTSCYNNALGAKNGREKFLFNPLNPGGSRRDDDSANCEDVVLDITKTSYFVRDLLKIHGEPDVFAFWIDVEGMEDEIVSELSSVCAGKETYFCVEYNKSLYDADAHTSFRSYMESRDELYTLCEDGMHEISDLSSVENNQDVVFSAQAR
jgi:FkbM family methyltransferase